MGFSPEHTRFPGTLTLKSETLIRLWTEIGECVAASGVNKLVLFNAHGGQVGAMDLVARDLRARLGMLVYSVNWFNLPLIDAQGQDVNALFSAEEHRFGIHAGEIETSMMLALKPEQVRMAQAEYFRSASQTRAADFPIVGNGKSAKLGWQMQDYNAEGAVGNAGAATAGQRARPCWMRPGVGWQPCCPKSTGCRPTPCSSARPSNEDSRPGFFAWRSPLRPRSCKAASPTDQLGISRCTASKTSVDSSGVRKLKTPIWRASPRLSAASHRKNEPPSGPSPSRPITTQSVPDNAVEGSSQAWHSRAKHPRYQREAANGGGGEGLHALGQQRVAGPDEGRHQRRDVAPGPERRVRVGGFSAEDGQGRAGKTQQGGQQVARCQ